MSGRCGWHELPWHPRVRTVAGGPDWVAVDKGAGVLSHPNRAGRDPQALLRAAWEPDWQGYRWGPGEAESLILCHRLDRPTSGVLLLARGRRAERIREAFENGEVRKEYRAVGVGRPERREFRWREQLRRVKTREGDLRVQVVRGGGQEAVTEGRELAFRRHPLPLTLLSLRPLTGRTHQLRVQASRHRVPLLGDRLYGDFGANKRFRERREGAGDRLYLHAYRLECPVGGELLRAEAALPEPFLALFPDPE